MNIIIDKDFAIFKKGQVVRVKTDKKRIPLSLYWRRRIAESKSDSCCHVETIEDLKTTTKEKV